MNGGRDQGGNPHADTQSSSILSNRRFQSVKMRSSFKNRLCDHLHTLARASDFRAVVESSPRAFPDHDRQRPADTLFSVSPFRGGAGGPLAVEVGVAAPHNLAGRRGGDPMRQYGMRKDRKSTESCAEPPPSSIATSATPATSPTASAASPDRRSMVSSPKNIPRRAPLLWCRRKKGQ